MYATCSLKYNGFNPRGRTELVFPKNIWGDQIRNTRVRIHFYLRKPRWRTPNNFPQEIIGIKIVRYDTFRKECTDVNMPEERAKERGFVITKKHIKKIAI